MEFKENLKSIRKEKKLSQKALGELIGKKEITIRNYESGKITPPIKVIEEIAEKLEVSIYQLLSSQEIDDIEKKKKIFEEWDKKLSINLMFLEYLEKYLEENGYNVKNSNTEMILKKDDCYIEISHEDFSKICEELNNYFLFLISKYKTQK